MSKIKPICNECKQECRPVEHDGIDDGNFYYLSDCCEEDVFVFGEFMSKIEYDQWAWDTCGGY